MQLDVTDEDSFAAFIAAAQQHSGQLDVLINNAGIMLTGRHLDQKPAAAQRMFEVNTIGPMRGVRLALPDMLKRRSGQIINISSLAGIQVAPGIVSYCASKHAIVGFTRGLQREHRRSGVRFTLVMPAFTHTGLSAGADSGDYRRARGHRPRNPRRNHQPTRRGHPSPLRRQAHPHLRTLSPCPHRRARMLGC